MEILVGKINIFDIVITLSFKLLPTVYAQNEKGNAFYNGYSIFMDPTRVVTEKSWDPANC